MKNCCIASLMLIALSFMSGCTKNASDLDPSQLTGRLTITGSSTVAPLVAELAKRFEQGHPNVRIDVQTGGSSKGIADARNGIAEIGMSSRALKEDESDLASHQIAADGVGMIVHQSNRVVELSDQQIREIYLGEITNWNQVDGGSDLALTVVHKAEGRATLEVFLEYFSIENSQVKADVIVGDNEHGVKTVAGAKGAIGYVSIGTAEMDVNAGVPIRLLPLGGVAASIENVASGAFPLSRPLNLVTVGSSNELALAFIAFCKSREVHDLIASQYFVPVTE